MRICVQLRKMLHNFYFAKKQHRTDEEKAKVQWIKVKAVKYQHPLQILLSLQFKLEH